MENVGASPCSTPLTFTADKYGSELTRRIAHLLAVAATVLEDGGTEDMDIAALLHDAVEDQGGQPRLSDVRNRFGDRVADIVHACSDSVVNSVDVLENE